MTTKRRRRLTADDLDTLIDELEAIRGMLPSAYGSVGDEDDEYGENDTEPGQIESAEVEVALSAVVSTMTVRCDLAVEPASLEELMELLFSSADDLVSIASNLEDAINGYFGELFGEDLDLADDYFGDLITALQERRDKWSKRKG